MRAPCIGAELDVEAHIPAPDGRAADPGPRVRDAEIRASPIGNQRKPRLLSAPEHELARSHAAAGEARERLQRKRHTRETCAAGVPIGSGSKTARVRQPRGEAACRRLRPLTAQVGVI